MKPYAKTILRSIRMTLPRFLAIFAIIALGVGFFAGLKVTTPSFVATADKYTKDYAMFDFKLLSTIGFTDDDIEELASRTSCVVEGAYSADCSAYLGESLSADTVRFLSITENVNKIKMESGRLPLRDDEVVADAYMLPSVEPGTKLVIADETSENAMKMFKYREYTVVGTARSPVYMNFQRGTSNEGSGKVSFYVCALPGAFDSEYYTEAYLYADNGLYLYSDEYKEWAEKAESQYKVALSGVINDRFESLLREEYDKLYDGMDEFRDGINEGRDELKDGRAALEDAKKELEDAQAEIDKNRIELEEGKKTLDSSKKEIDAYSKELTSTKVLLDAAGQRVEKAKTEMESIKSDVDSLYSEITEGRSEIRKSRMEIEARLSALEYLEGTYESVLASIDAGIENNKARLEEADNDWEKAIIQAQIDVQEQNRETNAKALEAAQKETERLNGKLEKLDEDEKALDEKQKEYEGKIASYNEVYQSYMSDKIQYDMGVKEYD